MARHASDRLPRPFRSLLIVAAVSMLLAACGGKATDPGAQRSAEADKQLRERLLHTQGRR